MEESESPAWPEASPPTYPRFQMNPSTYRAEVAALIAAGMAHPSRAEQTAARAEARAAREAIARFRQQWQTVPAHR